jgi:hypothetical protein
MKSGTPTALLPQGPCTLATLIVPHDQGLQQLHQQLIEVALLPYQTLSYRGEQRPVGRTGGAERVSAEIRWCGCWRCSGRG